MSAKNNFDKNIYLRAFPMRIPVQIIKQEKRDCLMVCLQMLLNFYKIKTTRDELDRFFIEETTAFSINPDLSEVALYVKKQGLEVDLISCNLFYTHIGNYPYLPPVKFIKQLEKLQKRAGNREYAIQIEAILRCLRAECNLILERPNLKRIEEYIQSGTPLIALVNSNALYDIPGEDLTTPHTVILCGIVADKFIILDPNHDEEKEIEKEQLLFAMQQAKLITKTGYLLAAKRKT
jgi:hypothetical protein